MPILTHEDLLDGDLLYEGQIKDTEDIFVRTGFNAEASAILPFGRAVAKGPASTGRTSDRLDLINVAGAGAVIVGIAMTTDTIEKRAGTPGTTEGASLLADGTMGWPVDYPVSYLIRGVIGVRVAQAVTPSSPVHVVHTASAGIFVGTFRADNTNAILLANARFLGYGAQNDIVPLSINLA